MSTIKRYHHRNQPPQQHKPSSIIEHRAQEPQDTLEVSREDPEKEWTVLIYMNGNNNLSEQAEAKLNQQLSEIDKSDKLNIVVHHSALRSRGYAHPNSINSVRYEVGNHSLKKLKELGPLNMGSSDTFAQFLSWGMKEYPAKHYLVVMQGHGGAWTGVMPDDVYNTKISLPDMDKAFDRVERETKESADVIAFDTCFEANAESAYQVRKHAKVMIGSEEVEAGMDDRYTYDVSAPYKEIFDTLSKDLERGEKVEADGLAKMWVKACENKWTTPTQSAFDLTKMDRLAKALDRLARTILDDGASLRTIRDIGAETKNMYDDPYKRGIDQWVEQMSHTYHLRDLYEFSLKIAGDKRIKNKEIKRAAREVLKGLRGVIIANEAGTDYNVREKNKYSEGKRIASHFDGSRNHGMSIFVPSNKEIMEFLEKEKTVPVKYRDIAFATETAWGKLVEELAKIE